MHGRTAQIGPRTASAHIAHRKRDSFALVFLPAMLMMSRIAVFGAFLGASASTAFAGKIESLADCDAATDVLIARFLDKTWSPEVHENITRQIQQAQAECEEKNYSRVQQSLKFIERLMTQNSQ